jgi:hypothetical protein
LTVGLESSRRDGNHSTGRERSQNPWSENEDVAADKIDAPALVNLI